MDALADVARIFRVTLSSMVCPSTAPTTVVTANSCPDLVIGKLSKGCTLAQVMLSLITERTITFHLFMFLICETGPFRATEASTRDSPTPCRMVTVLFPESDLAYGALDIGSAKFRNGASLKGQPD